MRGTRDTRPNIYMLNLTQQKKLMTDSTTPDEYFAGSAYGCKSKITLVDYHHTSCWIPTKSGLGKEITKNSSLLGQAYHWTWCTNIYRKKINHTSAPSETAKMPQINTGKGYPFRYRSRTITVSTIQAVRRHQ